MKFCHVYLLLHIDCLGPVQRQDSLDSNSYDVSFKGLVDPIEPNPYSIWLNPV